MGNLHNPKYSPPHTNRYHSCNKNTTNYTSHTIVSKYNPLQSYINTNVISETKVWIQNATVPIIWHFHYRDVIMRAMASQITYVSIDYSTVFLGPGERKHQSLASLAFVKGIHRWPVNSPQKAQWWRSLCQTNKSSNPYDKELPSHLR